MTTPKLVFHPNRLSISAVEAQNCLREIRLLLPSDSYRFDPRTGTLSVYGPGPMTRAAKIVRGFYPKAETEYTRDYVAWAAKLRKTKAEHETAAKAKNAAEKVKAAETARREAEAQARAARQEADRLREALRQRQESRGPSSDPSDPYTVLGVTRNADQAVVEAVYKALSKKFHPDLGGDPERMKAINAAYDKLRVK